MWLDVDAADWTGGDELVERILNVLPLEVVAPGSCRA
jgi:hypothetical protein